VKKRLAEADCWIRRKLFEAVPGRLVEIGPFEVEFIPVTHSTMIAWRWRSGRLWAW